MTHRAPIACAHRDMSPTLGKTLEWDTPPRARRDLHLNPELLDSRQLPPPADCPQACAPDQAIVQKGTDIAHVPTQ